jgi:hypothetical protein
MKRKPMYMSDYIRQLDSILHATGETILTTPGVISHQQAIDKAKEEYKKIPGQNPFFRGKRLY